MHHQDLQIILMALTLAPVAQKHHLTARALLDQLKQIRPALGAHFLERVAAMAARPPVQA
jgi:hypothetical protein